VTTSSATVALMGAVKPGAGQTQAGCSQAGQPDSGALRHHEPPDKHGAVKPGTVSPDPSSTAPASPMSVSSRGTPPLELDDMPCGVTLVFRRPPDGRLVFTRKPCKVKACEHCGPRVRARWAGEWSQAMASDQVYRLVVEDQEVAKLRRRKVVAGAELAHLPGPDGTRVVYTTALIGEQVRDLRTSLTSDFAAMPNDGRRRSRLSAGWRQVVDDAEAEAAAQREAWECLGRAGRSLEQVAMVATRLGLLVGRGPDMVVVEYPAPEVAPRLFALVKLERGWRRRQAEAA
jgi:hypothetical protein